MSSHDFTQWWRCEDEWTVVMSDDFPRREENSMESNINSHWVSDLGLLQWPVSLSGNENGDCKCSLLELLWRSYEIVGRPVRAGCPVFGRHLIHISCRERRNINGIVILYVKERKAKR